MECGLDEIYMGIVKRLVYKRTVINNDGTTTSEKDQERNIEIERGVDCKIPLIFKGFGNESPGLQNCNSHLI